MYPARLAKIIAFFEPLGEVERRENLLACAERVTRWAPRLGETFTLQDVRKDAECSDTVGIFLQVNAEGRVRLRVTLGPHVQTLTRALAAILCQGLEDATVEEVLALPADFVSRIVGAQLVRLRSQTVYYVLTRMKHAVRESTKLPGAKKP